jgi:hypothetical protein
MACALEKLPSNSATLKIALSFRHEKRFMRSEDESGGRRCVRNEPKVAGALSANP